jgi:hypothetical protein
MAADSGISGKDGKRSRFDHDKDRHKAPPASAMLARVAANNDAGGRP